MASKCKIVALEKLTELFFDEWCQWNGTLSWYQYVESKDLGICIVDDPHYSYIEVVDKKKWLLTKLKYGI